MNSKIEDYLEWDKTPTGTIPIGGIRTAGISLKKINEISRLYKIINASDSFKKIKNNKEKVDKWIREKAIKYYKISLSHLEIIDALEKTPLILHRVKFNGRFPSIEIKFLHNYFGMEKVEKYELKALWKELEEKIMCFSALGRAKAVSEFDQKYDVLVKYNSLKMTLKKNEISKKEFTNRILSFAKSKLRPNGTYTYKELNRDISALKKYLKIR